LTTNDPEEESHQSKGKRNPQRKINKGKVINYAPQIVLADRSKGKKRPLDVEESEFT
jgi:hypothetical protein